MDRAPAAACLTGCSVTAAAPPAAANAVPIPAAALRHTTRAADQAAAAPADVPRGAAAGRAIARRAVPATRGAARWTMARPLPVRPPAPSPIRTTRRVDRGIFSPATRAASARKRYGRRQKMQGCTDGDVLPFAAECPLSVSIAIPGHGVYRTFRSHPLAAERHRDHACVLPGEP